MQQWVWYILAKKRKQQLLRFGWKGTTERALKGSEEIEATDVQVSWGGN